MLIYSKLYYKSNNVLRNYGLASSTRIVIVAEIVETNFCRCSSGVIRLIALSTEDTLDTFDLERNRRINAISKWIHEFSRWDGWCLRTFYEVQDVSGARVSVWRSTFTGTGAFRRTIPSVRFFALYTDCLPPLLSSACFAPPPFDPPLFSFTSSFCLSLSLSLSFFSSSRSLLEKFPFATALGCSTQKFTRPLFLLDTLELPSPWSTPRADT